MRDYLPAAGVLLFSVCWAGALMAWPRDGQPVAALFPPSASERAFSGVVAAGADAVLGFGAVPGMVVAQSADGHFIKKLYERGALVVVRAPAKAECMR
ncbi:MAG: hypothetical protein ACM3Q1_15690 [Bacteroidales bacterium]